LHSFYDVVFDNSENESESELCCQYMLTIVYDVKQ